jgi:ergothioneine biosynthesis protein EgtB
MGFVREYLVRLDAIQHKFQSVRSVTELLVSPLIDEDFVLSATSDTSPPKWHLAHTSWFFENFVLKKLNKNYRPYKNEYQFLFNSYYKSLGSFIPKEKRNILSRPSAKDIFEYRKIITERVLEQLHSASEEKFLEVYNALEIGINHEHQHQELLLMDIKRNFYENPLRPKYHTSFSHGEYKASTVSWHNIPSELTQIGVSKNSLEFAFDNEKDLHNQWLESCMISSHLVTNGDYISFIEAGGYSNPAYWLSDGWDIKEKEKWDAPLYWEKEKSEWWAFTLGGMVPVDPAAPVCHVSYYEANAFAKWKGSRLPTEFEWEYVAKMEPSECTFLESGHYEPGPPLDDHKIFSQIHGGLWEWTQSSYHPYPRYEKYQKGLSEYNEKFMVNQFVMRGGSCVTPRSHYRVTYRNFYYPHMRWQYSGIRLAKDLL